VEALAGLAILGIAVAVMSALKERAPTQTVLTEVSALLGGGHDLSGFAAWGAALGAPCTFRFVTRTLVIVSERWTEIEVKLPAHHPLVLRLRNRQPDDHERIARGELVHVELADPAFTAAFLLEAAPADVIRHLFAPGVRAYLLEHRDVELATEIAEGPVLKLCLRGWLEALADARAAIELVVDLAIGVREAYARVEEEAPVAGAPFRPEPDARLVRRAAERRAEEVARLDQLQRSRHRG
jgi:hypothetical protein